MKTSRIPQPLLVLSVILLASVGQAQWVAFNDHAPGPGTHTNTTRFNIFGPDDGTNGLLRDVNTGFILPTRLSISRVGPSLDGRLGTNAAAGTPLYDAFQGYVDFSGNSCYVTTTNGRVTYSFSGLDPAKLYTFRGGAVGLSSLYTQRWTRIMLESAESFVNAHSTGVLTSAQLPDLMGNQVAACFATPTGPGRGEMVGWDDIAPGPDGSFAVACSAYPMWGQSSPSGFALTGVRLATTGLEPVSILTNPAPMTVLEGLPVTLRAMAAGFPIYYQWFKDGVPIEGATQPALTFTRAQTNDAGVYSVMASNAMNSVLSTDARLTVVPLRHAAITYQPVDQPLSNGMTASFSVGVEGDPPWTFQWCKDGIPVPGATNLTLTISNVLPSDAGLYRFTASNPASTATSSNATLTVIGWPVGGAGAVDTNFIASADISVRTILALPNGQVFIGGSFSAVNGVPRQKIALISPHGRLDPSFNLTNNVYTLRTVYAIVPQPDGKILVGVEGTFGYFRLQPNGTLDMSFGGRGFTGIAVRQIALLGDGKLLIAGQFYEIGRVPRYHLARLNADGSVDSTFDPGVGPNDIIRALLLLPDGRILIGGLFTNYNGATQYRLARLNPDASLDPSFLPGTNGANGDVYFLDCRGDKILVGGDFTAISGVPRKRIARLNWDGTVDPTFCPPGGVEGGPVYTISEQAYGQLVVGGLFTNVNGAPLNYLARLNADGSLDRSFQVGTGVGVGVFSTAVVPTDDLLVGGAFGAFGGVPCRSITRLVGRGGPFLQIGHQAGGPMSLWWQTNAVGFRLESRDELGAGDWHGEATPPTILGEWNTLLLDPTNQSRSFRLFKP